MFITKIKLQFLKAVICTWKNIMFMFAIAEIVPKHGDRDLQCLAADSTFEGY